MPANVAVRALHCLTRKAGGAVLEPTAKVDHHRWRFVMRALILLAAIVLVLMFVGWISFSKGPHKASINIESDKIRQDTKVIMGSGA